MRLVLDTNVWLDWLVFDDPSVAPLKATRADNRCEIFIDPPCRDELVHVLTYPRFALNAQAQTKLLAAVDCICTLAESPVDLAPEKLPFCKDPDDRKFLALALASNADWLITKDNALLVLARRKKRSPKNFKIGTSAHWAASLATGILPA